MELSWLMKLRISAAVAAGVGLIGLLGWPLAAPSEPSGVVSVFANGINFSDALILVVLVILAVLAGLLAYFLAWPYGREIGILAVPAGLAIWAVRSGNMANLMLLHSADQRPVLLEVLKWEPVFWLAVVAAGFAGVFTGQKIRQKTGPAGNQQESNSKSGIYLNAVIALVISVFIAQLCIRIFAQNVRIGSVVAQPATGQIVFAVLVSFAIAAFVAKKFFDVNYVWPIIGSALVSGFVITLYIKQDALQHTIQRWPVIFFSNAVISILPVQMVAFGTLGSIAGYWLAVRYNYWRKHEIK